MAIRRAQTLAVFTAIMAAFAILAITASGAQAATSTSVKTEYFKNACDGTLVPATQTVDRSATNTASFVVTLFKNTTGSSTASGAYRDCDTGADKTAPAVGVELKWEVTSGPCAGKTGTGVTGADGKFTFSLTGCGCGPDKIKLSVKKVVYKITTTTKTETTSTCTSWLLLICLSWKEETKVLSTTTTSVITDTYWYEVFDAFTVIWIGCDTTPPGKPTISCTGSPANDNTPTVSGTAEPGSTVTVMVNGNTVGTTTANGSGNWTFTLTTPLPDGTHTFSAKATDGSGNVSETSSTCTKTIDTTPPPKPTIVCSGSPTNDNTPTFSGTAEAGSTVTIYANGNSIGTTTANGSGNWTFTPSTPLPDGTHVFTVRATDVYGNQSASSESCTKTIDTTPPPITVTCAEPGTDTTPTITGTSEPGSTVTVYVDGSEVGTTVTDAEGNWSFTLTTPLSPGNHTVAAKSTDTNGNSSPVSEECTLTVTTPPDPPVDPPTPPTPPTPPVNPPVSGQGTPSATLTLAKTCTKPYILIKPSVSGGTPRSMVVYVDGKRVGSDTKAPFQFRLYTKRYTATNHKVKVVIRYTNGASTTITKRFKPCARFSASARVSPRFTG